MIPCKDCLILPICKLDHKESKKHAIPAYKFRERLTRKCSLIGDFLYRHNEGTFGDRLNIMYSNFN